jgi:hypothetical protein
MARRATILTHPWPIVIASGLLNKPVSVPWWNGLPLRLTA